MKIKSTLVAAAAALFLTACGSSVENNPEAVTKAFVKALYNKNFKEAAGYCTETSGKVVEGMELMAANAPTTAIEKEEVKCEMKGEDKAVCTFCCAADKAEETYNLVKENGNWKVDFVKGGIQQGMDQLEDAVDELSTEGTEENIDTTAVE